MHAPYPDVETIAKLPSFPRKRALQRTERPPRIKANPSVIAPFVKRRGREMAHATPSSGGCPRPTFASTTPRFPTNQHTVAVTRETIHGPQLQNARLGGPTSRPIHPPVHRRKDSPRLRHRSDPQISSRTANQQNRRRGGEANRQRSSLGAQRIGGFARRPRLRQTNKNHYDWPGLRTSRDMGLH